MARAAVGTQLAVAVAAAAVAAIAVGVPSALITNPLFTRMTPVPWWSYLSWVMTAVLSGMLAATYVHRRSTSSVAPQRAGIVANVTSVLAVGCPVCNKLVVAAIGTSGALSVWAPVQPVLAFGSVALLVWALWRRMTTLRACPVISDRAPVTPLVTTPPSPDREE